MTFDATAATEHQAEAVTEPENLAVVSVVFPEARTFTLPDNLTIAEMMAASGISRRMQRQATCIIRNEATGKERNIPRRVWHLVKVRPGERAILRILPRGGGRSGGKSTLGLILSVVVMAASAFATWGVSAALAGTSLSAGAIGAIGSLVGGVVPLIGRYSITGATA